MRMSFCMTCMGRLHHLRETVLENLAVIEKSPGAECVLLNYNSPDELELWIKFPSPLFMDPLS
jgi:hypothetical protein